jgi:hypothetical protein
MREEWPRKPKEGKSHAKTQRRKEKTNAESLLSEVPGRRVQHTLDSYTRQDRAKPTPLVTPNATPLRGGLLTGPRMGQSSLSPKSDRAATETTAISVVLLTVQVRLSLNLCVFA